MTVTSWTGQRAVLIDTGPLFAATDVRDQYHFQARRGMQRLADDRMSVVVLFPVLWECYSLVVRRHSLASAHAWITEVRNNGYLVAPNADDYLAAIQLPPRYADQTITLFDAILAVMSERFNLPVWTFDHHFDVMRIAVWR